DSPLLQQQGERIDSSKIAFRVVGSAWIAEAGTYAVRHDGTALQVTPFESEIDPEIVIPSDALTLTTTHITQGAELAVGSHVSTRSGDLEISGAGFVEHLTARPIGVEQTWEFPTALTGAGDLVVTLEASGAPFAAQTASGLHFGAPGHL